MENETLSFISSFIGMAFIIASYLVKDKRLYLLFQSLCIAFLILSYFFGGNYFGMIGLGVGLARALTFFFYEKQDKNAPIFWSFVFSVLTVGSYFIVNLGILKTAQPLDVLCMSALVMYAFIFRIRSLKIVRFTMLVPTVLSILYNVFASAAIFTTLTYVIELCVNLVSIVRFHILPAYKNKYGHFPFVHKKQEKARRIRMKQIKIAPSILSANFAKMGEEVRSLEQCGADVVHCDVMDGVFVNNITFGIKMVEDIRKCTSLPLDCHLMIVHPEKYVERFAKAGADIITVHWEACKDNLKEVLALIKSTGVKCGAVINPDTPVEKIEEVIPLCDMVLVMSVFPGFGGQKFIPSSLDKLREIRAIIDASGKDIDLEIDGGVTAENVAEIKAAGANVIVAGSAVFNAADRAKTIAELKA